MNVTIATKANKKVPVNLSPDIYCKDITKSVITFNRLLTNTSNKLGLSKAIYLK